MRKDTISYEGKLNTLRQRADSYRRLVRREMLLRIEREKEIKELRLENARLAELVDARFTEQNYHDVELKPQVVFTEDEKAILRLLPTNYRWIARDKDDNRLYVYALKPEKGASAWVIWSGKVMSLGGFKHLFESIKWKDEEPCEFRKYI